MINNSNRKRLATEALQASASLRKKMGFDLTSPISIYDLCDRAGVPVRFVEINMEGMYINLGEGATSTIFLSALRPFHRKVYTCAHEYGHHLFGHGMSVDEITTSEGEYSPDEFLVDTFASYLLMPPLGLKSAFIKRGWKINEINASQCFSLACSFGVGYSTMIKHLLYNSHITKSQSDRLLRTSLKTIKQTIIGKDVSETLFMIDDFFTGKTIDVETTGYIQLPNHIKVEDERYLKKIREDHDYNLYRILIPGITRVYSLLNEWSCFVRIQKAEYVGLSCYRHLAE